jgi:hypothetical protein
MGNSGKSSSRPGSSSTAASDCETNEYETMPKALVVDKQYEVVQQLSMTFETPKYLVFKVRKVSKEVKPEYQVLKLYLHENEMKHFKNEIDINMNLPTDHPNILRANLIKSK